MPHGVRRCWLLAHLIDGIIHVVRDPVDFMMSSMRNTRRGGLAWIVEHSLRYRPYHAPARQAYYHAHASIVLNYERLGDNVESELNRLFRSLRMAPMTLAESRPFFDQEWHFMGNISLLGFDGMIRPSRHGLTPGKDRLFRKLAGAGR